MENQTIARDSIVTKGELIKAGWKHNGVYFAYDQIWKNCIASLHWNEESKKVTFFYSNKSTKEPS